MAAVDTPVSAPPLTESWQAMLSAPRHRASRAGATAAPAGPGVYAWFRDDQCVYVGKAKNLRARLTTHLAGTLDLSRSTLRASVAVLVTGVTRATARRRPSVMTGDQIAAVSDWMAACDVAWRSCDTEGQAVDLERALRASWMPPLNRV